MAVAAARAVDRRGARSPAIEDELSFSDIYYSPSCCQCCLSSPRLSMRSLTNVTCSKWLVALHPLREQYDWLPYHRHHPQKPAWLPPFCESWSEDSVNHWFPWRPDDFIRCLWQRKHLPLHFVERSGGTKWDIPSSTRLPECQAPAGLLHWHVPELPGDSGTPESHIHKLMSLAFRRPVLSSRGNDSQAPRVVYFLSSNHHVDTVLGTGMDAVDLRATEQVTGIQLTVWCWVKYSWYFNTPL